MSYGIDLKNANALDIYDKFKVKEDYNFAQELDLRIKLNEFLLLTCSIFEHLRSLNKITITNNFSFLKIMSMNNLEQYLKDNEISNTIKEKITKYLFSLPDYKNNKIKDGEFCTISDFHSYLIMSLNTMLNLDHKFQDFKI